jgi:putative CocE/NonD family hydrolase
MPDGVKIAVDVHLPVDADPGEKFPAVLELTRYWRSAIDPATGKVVRALSGIDRRFLARDYAIVKVDVRGSGASFGHRLEEYGPAEVRDGFQIVDWVAQQPWCNGHVGAYGISYSGTTAELLAASKHPALKAVIPGWSDFDLYASPGRPYGLVPEAFINEWSEMVDRLDRNDVDKLGASVKPVDPALLSAALAEHERNPDVAQMEAACEFRDVGFNGSRPLGECTSPFWKAEIEASGVPMLVMASWLDAGTADGALLRFQNYRNPQYLVILASSHGGGFHASPYAVGQRREPCIPPPAEQLELRLEFFDHFLKGLDNQVTQWPRIRYFNMGEESMRQSEVWPPAGTQPRRLFLADEGRLDGSPPSQLGRDRYDVDFDVNTGPNNRWSTQMGGPVLGLDHREAMDQRMLCYTSEPLASEWQLTGTPEVQLWMSTSAGDGYVLAYLEDVSPDGQSRYLSEGGLRFLHRRPATNPLLAGDPQFHSFHRQDAMPVTPGQLMEVGFKMWPTSVRIAAGHRIRLAIAGADQAVFGRIPPEGEVVFEVVRGQPQASVLTLPVVEGR